MPVMDGLEATLNIRRYHSNAQIKIVALTAYACDTFEVKCKEAGMDEFFTKPVNEENITRLVRELKLKD